MSPRSWTGRVFIAVSLDGFIARPDGDIRWLTYPSPNSSHIRPSSPRTVDGFDQHMTRVDCILMGRKSYEKGLSCPQWPYGTKPTFVLSAALESLPLPATGGPVSVRLVRSLDDAAEVLEKEGVRGVYVDGGLVVQGFLRRGWIEELVVTQAPVLLGDGIPLFGSGSDVLDKDVPLTLLGVDVIEDGMVSVWYRIGAQETPASPGKVVSSGRPPMPNATLETGK